MLEEKAVNNEQLVVDVDIINNNAGAILDEPMEELGNADKVSSITLKSRHGKHIDKHCAHPKCHGKVISGRKWSDHKKKVHPGT